jgi:hypothetical protein
VPADGTARLLDYQELTSSIVDADIRLGPEADVRGAFPRAEARLARRARSDALGWRSRMHLRSNCAMPAISVSISSAAGLSVEAHGSARLWNLMLRLPRSVMMLSMSRVERANLSSLVTYRYHLAPVT